MSIHGYAFLIGTIILASAAVAGPALPVIVGLKGEAQVLSKTAAVGLPSLLYEGEKFFYVRAKIGLKVEKNSMIICSSDCHMKLVYPSGSSIYVSPGATFRVLSGEDSPKGESSILRLLYGRLRSIVSKSKTQGFQVHTPTVVTGVRGTDFLTRHAPTQGTEVTVLGGKVEVTPVDVKQPKITLSSHQSISQSPSGEFVTTQASKAAVLSAYETTLVPAASAAEQPSVQHLEDKSKAVALEELRVSQPAVFSKIDRPEDMTISELNRTLVEQPLQKAKSTASGAADPIIQDLENYKKYMGEGK